MRISRESQGPWDSRGEPFFTWLATKGSKEAFWAAAARVADHVIIRQEVEELDHYRVRFTAYQGDDCCTHLVFDQLPPPRSTYQDVAAFHEKFGVPSHLTRGLGLLPEDELEFRLKFLLEELRELSCAHQEKDLVGFLDGLLDLVYVAHGTALMAGVSPELWQALWATVQQANMAKIRAPSAEASASATGRGHRFDVIKPEGWAGPAEEQRRLVQLAMLAAYEPITYYPAPIADPSDI